MLLDIHLPFSYWRERDFDLGAPARRPDQALVGAYVRALAQELASLGPEVEGHEVDAVFFSGGYLGLLYPDTFRDLLRAVRRSFSCAGRLKVDGVTFPGSLDMYSASAYLDERVGSLMFEVPTLSGREAAALGLPNALQALDKSLYVLESYGAARFGLRVPCDIPGRTRETWEYLAGQVNHYRPDHVELAGLPGAGADSGHAPRPSGAPVTDAALSACAAGDGLGPLAAAEGSAQTDSAQEAGGLSGGVDFFASLLAESGYREVPLVPAPSGAPGRRFFTRADEAPAYVRAWGAAQASAGTGGPVGPERVGVGLGAVTVLDGYLTRDTPDMQAYLKGAADYRQLLVEVREL